MTTTERMEYKKSSSVQSGVLRLIRTSALTWRSGLCACQPGSVHADGAVLSGCSDTRESDLLGFQRIMMILDHCHFVDSLTASLSSGVSWGRPGRIALAQYVVNK